MKALGGTQSMLNQSNANPFVQSLGLGFGQQTQFNPFASTSPQPASRLIYSTDKKKDALDLDTD